MPDDPSGTLVWVAALLAGGLLGVFFFAGLWWTVRRSALSPTGVAVRRRAYSRPSGLCHGIGSGSRIA